MLYRVQIRNAVVAALQAANTLAGQKVYASRDWPLTPPGMPSILVLPPQERKAGRGPTGAAQFLSVATVAIHARVSGTSYGQVEDQLDTLCEQIENAVLTDYAILRMVQQVLAVDTEVEITAAQREHLGEAWMRFDFEYPELFAPTITQPLTDIHGTVDAVANGSPAPPLAFEFPIPQE
ncbi:hypothetical protein BUE93_21460 [Chromobacterium amazonense]|uniref:Phage tail protein n=1 Tax=Chromobacterium amazonense TaxID=1382803 RepID=A0A2S9WYS0_9NEIS|nr:hypothetical protein [Chromobacterium amazonense]PRP68611.1 hypothetical protein BUE93_21460 [Chromobacterium amazonense]